MDANPPENPPGQPEADVTNLATGDVESLTQAGHNDDSAGTVQNVFHGTATKVVQMGNVQGGVSL